MVDRRLDTLSTSGALRRNLVRLCVVAAVAWGLHLGLGWARLRLGTGGPAGTLMPMLIIGTLALYALMIAVPFVPGVEIGLALMAIEGPTIAPWIYLATLCGLTLAYAAGALVPYALLYRVLADLRLTRACHLLAHVAPLGPEARLELLRSVTPVRLRPLLRFRYLVVALLVNIPGNAAAGGGGGILFLAGFSRLFSPLGTVATLALAVAPVPLLYWCFGTDATGWLK